MQTWGNEEKRQQFAWRFKKLKRKSLVCTHLGANFLHDGSNGKYIFTKTRKKNVHNGKLSMEVVDAS